MEEVRAKPHLGGDEPCAVSQLHGGLNFFLFFFLLSRSIVDSASFGPAPQSAVDWVMLKTQFYCVCCAIGLEVSALDGNGSCDPVRHVHRCVNPKKCFRDTVGIYHDMEMYEKALHERIKTLKP